MTIRARYFNLPTCSADFETERLRRLQRGVMHYVSMQNKKGPVVRIDQSERMFDQSRQAFIQKHNIPAEYVRKLEEQTRLVLALQEEILTITPWNKVRVRKDGVHQIIPRYVRLMNFHEALHELPRGVFVNYVKDKIGYKGPRNRT